MIVGDLVDAGLAEIRTGPFGTQLKASDYVETGRAVLNVRNVGFGDVRPDKLEYVDEPTAQRLSAHLLEEGDIVFGRKGAVERHAFITRPFVGAMQGSDCIRLRLRADAPIRPRFASFALRTTEHQAWMQAFCSHGATMASLNQEILRQICLPDLPLQAQDAVIAVLGSMEDTIENNRRRIELLEDMSRAIYREWFVRFCFPGHEEPGFPDSTVGSVPTGWSAVPLVDVAEITMGQSPRSEFYNLAGIGKPFHQGVADFGLHFPNHRKYCSIDARLANDGDVLVSVRAPVGRINLADRELVIGRGLAAVRSRTGHPSLLLQALKEVFAEEDSMGGGTIFNAIGKRELEQVPVLVAPSPVADAAERVLAPMLAMIRQLTFATRELAALRDLLLPRLISGTTDVSSLDLDAVGASA